MVFSVINRFFNVLNEKTIHWKLLAIILNHVFMSSPLKTIITKTESLNTEFNDF